MIIINQSNKALLQLALQIAAEKFKENIDSMNEAHKLSKSPADSAFKRMANQFGVQQRQAEELADLIAQYDDLALANENEMLRSYRTVEIQR